jgi:hypothetical protein
MMNGSLQQGHVRYPLYNASKNETLKKRGKRENLMGKSPPPKVQCIKRLKKNKRQLLSNCVLHSKETLQMCKFKLDEDFVEDVDVCTGSDDVDAPVRCPHISTFSYCK